LEQSKLSWDMQRGKVTSPDAVNFETLPLSYAVVASVRGGKPSKINANLLLIQSLARE